MIIAPMTRQSLSTPANPWLTRLLTLLLAALAAGSVLYWFLQWPAATPPLRAALPTADEPPDPDKIARLLGAGQRPAAVEAAVNLQANFKLLGIIVQGGAGTRGSALIAVEGRPPKPYRVGDAVADALVLHSVRTRTAYLAANPAAAVTVTLELPALK